MFPVSFIPRSSETSHLSALQLRRVYQFRAYDEHLLVFSRTIIEQLVPIVFLLESRDECFRGCRLRALEEKESETDSKTQLSRWIRRD